MIEIDSAIALTLDSLNPEAAVLSTTGDILFVNRRWKEFAGANGMRAPDFGVGENYLFYCDQDNSRYREYSEQIAEGLRAVIAGVRPEFYIEYPCPSPRGEQWFALRFNPLQHADETPLFLMVHDEITAKVISMRHLKETNEILRESRDRAEAASHYKSKFVATLSHEIRTPLNAILGLTDILHGEIEQNEHRQYLEHVQNAGSILLNLLNDILDLTRLEQGKLQLQNTPFSVRHSILNSVLAYRYLVERKGLQFNVHINDRLPDMLYGDAFRLNQILSNLISNALKFTRAGEVKIELD
ncbi:MAG: hypothetical protein KDK30_15585, partial [Leptospiraceae bacterium]|nr:hypothetical protein [Leptospiraceae bacterium]